MYSITDTELKECPASFIRPESMALVMEIHAANQIHEATGSAFYGPDSSRWDARWFDAVRTVAVEEIRISNSEYEVTRAGNFR